MIALALRKWGNIKYEATTNFVRKDLGSALNNYE